MAVSETVRSCKINLKLDNGLTSTGAVRTVSVSLGSVVANPDLDKVMAIVNPLAQCLSKSVSVLQKVVTSDFS